MDLAEFAGVATLVGTGSASAASLITLYFTKRREARQDEVAVLQTSVTELRADRDGFRRELQEHQAKRDAERKETELELRRLKDDHTTCLLAHAKMQGKLEAMEERLKVFMGKQHVEDPDSGGQPAPAECPGDAVEGGRASGDLHE